MSETSIKLDDCLNQLVMSGERCQGYVTYQTINDVTANILKEIIIDAIDRIYRYLKSK